VECSCECIKKGVTAADKEWSSSFRVGRWSKTPHRKNINLLRNVIKGLGLRRILSIKEIFGRKRDEMTRVGENCIRGSFITCSFNQV
jgi:hypothetical protein